MSSVRELSIPLQGGCLEGYESKSGGLVLDMYRSPGALLIELDEDEVLELWHWFGEWLGIE